MLTNCSSLHVGDKDTNLFNYAWECLSPDKPTEQGLFLRKRAKLMLTMVTCLQKTHVKVSCHCLTEQFHSTETHFDFTGDEKPV